MKLAYQLLLSLSGTILFSCFLTLNNLNFLNLKPSVNSDVVLAQTPSEYRNDINEIYRALRTKPNRTTEVFYRSAKLQHRDTNTTVFVETIYRLMPRERLHSTPLVKIIINSNGKTITQTFYSESGEKEKYSLSPGAFSPNGKYLIIEGIWGLDIPFNIILDAENNYQQVNYSTACPSPQGIGSAKGFISPSKVLFECYLGSGRVRSYLVVNLTDGSAQKQNLQFVNSVNFLTDSYEYVARPSIIKVQHF